MIHYGDEDEMGIPKPVGQGDEIQFLIPARWIWVR